MVFRSGLPLVTSLVEEHGGTLTPESDSHVGTAATIMFPVKRVIDAEAEIAGNIVVSGAA